MGLEIINQLKKEQGLTNAQLSRMSGVTLSTLDKITAGANQNPKLETLLAICRALGCRLEDFDDGPAAGRQGLSSGAMSVARSYDTLDSHGRAAVRGLLEEEVSRMESLARLATVGGEAAPKVIPLYLTPAAAGYASPVFGEDYQDYTLTAEDPPGAVFAVRLQGDSMEPYFPDGSLVFCNKDPLADGDIGVFYVGSGTVCKQYHRRGGVTYLLSLNRARSDTDVVLTPESNQAFSVQGRVITRRRIIIPPHKIN